MKSWLWERAAAKGSEGSEQLLSSATSLTPERLLPAVLLLQFPSVSGFLFGSSCRKKLSDNDGFIILTCSQVCTC